MVGGWGLQAWWGPEALATCGWRRLCAAQATTTGLQTLADLRRGVWHAARPRCELAHVTAGRLAVAGWMGRGACLPRADVCVSQPCVAGQVVSQGMPQNRLHCWSRPHVSTPVGFEPTRGDPIGLAGRRLSRSAKVSSVQLRTQESILRLTARWFLGRSEG